MTLSYVASELDALNRYDTNTAEVTTGGSYDSSYGRASVRLGAGASGAVGYAETPTLGSALTTAWIHFELYTGGTSSNGVAVLTAYNSSGTAVFRLITTTGNTFKAQYWNGSAWTDIGSTYSFSSATKYIFDLKIICGGSGSFELFQGGSSILSGSASMTAVTNIQKVRLHDAVSHATSTNHTHASQLIIDSTSTISWKAESKPPTSNGTDVDGTGGYAEIDETTLDTADILQLSSAGDKHSFKSAARTGGTGFVVKGVTVTALAKCGATGPQSLKFYLLIGGTRYYSGSIALTTAVAPYQYTWATNPATGAAWATSAAQDANLEWGYEAAA